MGPRVKDAFSKISPLLFGALAWVAFLAPDVMGCLMGRGITLGPVLSIIWIGCTLSPAIAGVVLGIRLARNNLSISEIFFVSLGMLLSMAAGLLMLGLLSFLISGGG